MQTLLSNGRVVADHLLGQHWASCSTATRIERNPTGNAYPCCPGRGPGLARGGREARLLPFYRFAILLWGALGLFASNVPAHGAPTPPIITPDANTLVLDHFDGTSGGTTYGTATYEPQRRRAGCTPAAGVNSCG